MRKTEKLGERKRKARFPSEGKKDYMMIIIWITWDKQVFHLLAEATQYLRKYNISALLSCSSYNVFVSIFCALLFEYKSTATTKSPLMKFKLVRIEFCFVLLSLDPYRITP